MLDKKVDELAEGAERACEVLEGESQALWAVLRLSLQQQFGYWVSLVHPSQVAGAAARVDRVLRKVLEKVAGGEIPKDGGGLDYTCAMGPEVGWLERVGHFRASSRGCQSSQVGLDFAVCWIWLL